MATGYLGTILIAVLILITASGSQPLTFLMAAVLFAVFAAPIFLVVREPRSND